MLLQVARPLATFALLSALYTIAAWRMGRLAGVLGLLLAWAGGVALAAAYGAGRLYQPQGALGWQPGQQHDTTSFSGAATFMAVCLGAATFVVGWRQGRGATRLGVGGVVAGTAASLAGFLANMLMFGFADLAHVLGQH
jgi:hypothetical protein